MLAVGGSPGRAYEPPEFTVEGGSHLPIDKYDLAHAEHKHHAPPS